MRGVVAGGWLAFLVVPGLAWARPEGMPDHSGQNGAWCIQCHATSDGGPYSITLDVTPGPYVAGVPVPVKLRGWRDRPFHAGLNVTATAGAWAVDEDAGAGPVDVVVERNQIRHSAPRNAVDLGDGGFEVGWSMTWAPPVVGSNMPDTLRIYAASQGSGSAAVITDDGVSPCKPTDFSHCGVPVTVPLGSCEDVDLDGFVATSCEPDPNLGGGDCDDLNPLANPAQMELCDGFDNNCVGGVDEGFTYGNKALGAACDGSDVDFCLNGIVECRTDFMGARCTETVHMTELCNGVDDTCNGVIDEGCALDAGTTPDASSAGDAAVTADASFPLDAAVPPDANITVDASLPEDAAVTPDAAVIPDAAELPDAAAPSSPDAAVVEVPDAAVASLDGAVASPGGSDQAPRRCSATDVNGGTGGWGVLAAALWLRASRRRR